MRVLMATLSREVVASGPSSCLAYFAGALRDGTFSSQHGTWRLAQKAKDWLLVVRVALQQLGANSWIYREGKDRSVWVLETCCRPSDRSPLLQSRAENAAFVRGYFDAEGGIPQAASARYYVQLAQKNRSDLEELRQRMQGLGLACGSLHLPSVAADPDYWRFYVSAAGHRRFYETVGSWHRENEDNSMPGSGQHLFRNRSSEFVTAHLERG